MEVQMVKHEFWANFHHCPVCLKMKWSALEWRYAEWLVTITQVAVVKHEFQPNFQHCLISLEMVQNAVEWGYA